MGWNGVSVLVGSALSTRTGYGKDGIQIVETLMDAGADVHMAPLNVSVPLPPKVAALFAKNRLPRYNLMLHHTDPGQLKSFKAMHSASDLVVGWTMWEFTGFGGDSFEAELRSNLAMYDALIGYDETSVGALSQHYDGPLLKLQGGYRAKDWSFTGRDWDGVFRFATLGALNARKNPFALIEAFSMLKKEHGDDFNAELWMKNNSQTLHPAIEEWAPGVRIFYESWPIEKLVQFYGSVHCYVAPSWGEGKNLPALEALTTGCPVIVSECGGHKEWFDSDMGWMLSKSTWEEHDPVRNPGKSSLRVDVRELADTMWEAYTNRGECRRRGEYGSRAVPVQCDWTKVVDRLYLMLQKVRPEGRPGLPN